MTTLEIILLAIVWISYGVFGSYQEKDYDGLFWNIIFAPVLLVIRAIWGIFSSKFFDK